MARKTKNRKRWLVCYVAPNTGRERLGTGPEAQTFAYYVSVDNVIKYQLSQDHYPAGQYHIYSWPEGNQFPENQKPFVAYKRAR